MYRGTPSRARRLEPLPPLGSGAPKMCGIDPGFEGDLFQIREGKAGSGGFRGCILKLRGTLQNQADLSVTVEAG